nr:tRNA (guanosine(37)-N1)-methyltransferase TrmD [Anaeromicropila populeti]
MLTLFPEMIEDGMKVSIMGRAIEKQLLSITTINIRDFAANRHGKVDDYPYGGGAGMVMQPEPIYQSYLHALKLIREKRGLAADEELTNIRTIYLTPQGRVFKQKMAKEFAKEEDIILLCGHYEGVDERVLELIVTDHISIGDYVLTGGELPAMVVMDSISRLVPGVLNNDDSAETESFSDNTLEYPQYTRPVIFMERTVPEVLLSGHHKNIEHWRKEASLKRTLERRPDLLSGKSY